MVKYRKQQRGSMKGKAARSRALFRGLRVTEVLGGGGITIGQILKQACGHGPLNQARVASWGAFHDKRLTRSPPKPGWVRPRCCSGHWVADSSAGKVICLRWKGLPEIRGRRHAHGFRTSCPSRRDSHAHDVKDPYRLVVVKVEGRADGNRRFDLNDDELARQEKNLRRKAIRLRFQR